MAGQYNTIRDEATGRLRKTTPEEREQFETASGAVTQRDMDFQAENGGQEPPPLPDASTAGPPPAQPGEEYSEEVDAAGAVAGASLGGPVAAGVAAVGAGVSYAASQSFKRAPVGSLEGSGQTGAGDQEVLRQLLAVQRGIARVGSPIKDAILTKSSGSRL